jgi:hypothetical protein
MGMGFPRYANNSRFEYRQGANSHVPLLFALFSIARWLIESSLPVRGGIMFATRSVIVLRSLVLRSLSRSAGLAAVVITAAGLLPACSGSGNEETVTLRLSADEACYGIEIDVDRSGLSAVDSGTPQSCVAADELLALGCEAGTRITNDEYQLSVRGCFAPDTTPIFECTLPKALAQRFRDESVIRCGCGCAINCPSSVAALVCDQNGASCEAGAPVSAPAQAAAQPESSSNVQTSYAIAHGTTVTSTTNHTNCDAHVDPGVASTGDDTIREIRFDLTFDPDGCDYPDCSPESPDIDGPVRFEDGRGDTIHVCLSSKAGFTNPADLLDCSAETGGNDEFVITNVTALDERLKPITPPPVLVNDEND